MPNGMHGTGESLVNGFDKAEYTVLIDPEVVAQFFCTYYGVAEPVLKKLPARANGGWGGRYSYKTRTVTYSIEWTGVIVHELAHHIDRMLNGSSPHVHHGERFSSILQEMVDLWK